MNKLLQIIFLTIAFAVASIVNAQQTSNIKPTKLWDDNNGNHIQIYEGKIAKIVNTLYWNSE